MTLFMLCQSIMMACIRSFKDFIKIFIMKEMLVNSAGAFTCNKSWSIY